VTRIQKLLHPQIVVPLSFFFLFIYLFPISPLCARDANYLISVSNHAARAFQIDRLADLTVKKKKKGPLFIYADTLARIIKI